MAGGLYPVSGSKIFISTNSVTPKGKVELSDFTGLSWVEIDGWVNAGGLGDTQGIVEQELINQGRVRKMKTTLNAGNMENQFVPLALDAGQKKFKDAITSCKPYAFKVEWGGSCAPESVVTITQTDPGVVTWADHGFEDGQPISFQGTTLPAGIIEDTVYYVRNKTSGSFELGLTSDAQSSIDTSGSLTLSEITAFAPPAGMTDYFYGLALPGERSGGGASDVHLRTYTIAVDSNIVDI